jgi:hypothetical protein
VQIEQHQVDVPAAQHFQGDFPIRRLENLEFLAPAQFAE